MNWQDAKIFTPPISGDPMHAKLGYSKRVLVRVEGTTKGEAQYSFGYTVFRLEGISHAPKWNIEGYSGNWEVTHFCEIEDPTTNQEGCDKFVLMNRSVSVEIAYSVLDFKALTRENMIEEARKLCGRGFKNLRWRIIDPHGVVEIDDVSSRNDIASGALESLQRKCVLSRSFLFTLKYEFRK